MAIRDGDVREALDLLSKEFESQEGVIKQYESIIEDLQDKIRSLEYKLQDSIDEVEQLEKKVKSLEDEVAELYLTSQKDK